MVVLKTLSVFHCLFRDGNPRFLTDLKWKGAVFNLGKFNDPTLAEEKTVEDIRCIVDDEAVATIWEEVQHYFKLDQSVYVYSGGWRRDLTMECVEPNPGPKGMMKFFDKVANEFENVRVARDALANVELSIRNTITSPGGLGYTDVHVKAFFETNTPAETKILLQATADVADPLDSEVRARLGLQAQVPAGFSSAPGAAQAVPPDLLCECVEPNLGPLGWKRELLRECIEPNPGPAMGIVFDNIAAKFGQSSAIVRNDLQKIEDKIASTQQQGKYGFTGEHVETYFRNLSLEDFALITENTIEDAREVYKEARLYLGLQTPVGTSTTVEILQTRIKQLEASEFNFHCFTGTNSQIWSHARTVVQNSNNILGGFPEFVLTKSVWDTVIKQYPIPNKNALEKLYQDTIGKMIKLIRETYIQDIRNKDLRSRVLDIRCPNTQAIRQDGGIPDGVLFQGLNVYSILEVKPAITESDKGQAIRYIGDNLKNIKTHGDEYLGATQFGALTDLKRLFIFKVTDTPGQKLKIECQELDFSPSDFPSSSCGVCALMRILLASPAQLGHNLGSIIISTVPIMLQKVLGAGSQTTVYLAENGQEQLAIKTYVHFSVREEGRLRQEVAILKQLCAEGIQRLHPTLNPAGANTLCTFYGGTQLSFMTNLVASTAQSYVIQILKVMDFVEQSGWCHGDLHPGNVVVNDAGVITIVDWEVAIKNGHPIINLTGIPAFASTRILQYAQLPLVSATGYHYTWCDDLESIAYIFAAITGKLAWHPLDGIETILQKRGSWLIRDPFYRTIIEFTTQQNLSRPFKQVVETLQ